MNFSRRKTTLALFLVVFVCFIGSLTVSAIGAATGHHRLWGLTQLLNMDGDRGFPTWFNSFLLALLVALSWMAARTLSELEARRDGGWKGLAILFLFMSIEEVATIHEEIGGVLSDHFHFTGYLRHAFVVIGVPLAGLLFCCFLPFLRRLPHRVSKGFLLSGGVYLVGAAGVEAMSANWLGMRPSADLVYIFLAHVEELLEMTGLILFLSYLMEHLSDAEAGTFIRIKP